MTTLKDIADVCVHLPEGASSWVDELIGALAKVECKTRKDIPSWSKLTAAQKLSCREAAEGQLQTVVDFFQMKLDGEKNG